MPLGPYTIFHKAGDHLVKEFKLRRSGKVSPGEPIVPITIILFAKLDDFGAITSPFSNYETSPALIVSDLEDKAGPIPECAYRQFTIKAPPALTQMNIFPEDRIMMHVKMTIKPPGIRNNLVWPIEYHPGDGTFYLGFKGVMLLEKMG